MKKKTTQKIYQDTRKHSSFLNRFSGSLTNRGKKALAFTLLVKSLSHQNFLEASKKVAKKQEKEKIREKTESLFSFKNKKKTREKVDSTTRGNRHDTLDNLQQTSQKVFYGNSICKEFSKTSVSLCKNNLFRFTKPLLKASPQKIGTRNPQTFLLAQKALENVKPVIETRKVRRGRLSYPVPFGIKASRQQGVAMRWLIDSARKKHKVDNNNFIPSLTEQLKLSQNKKVVPSDTQNKQHALYRLALDNRAYLHLRWW